jgi:predicted O-methyltransferase YrrM
MYPIQQHEGEIDQFISILKKEKVKSFLEIGSKFGGSLWRIANALPKGSKIVSVDLPWGDRKSEPFLIRCRDNLRKAGYDVNVILGDSTDPLVIEKVRLHAPFDAVLIDANHTEPYVWKDWHNYGTMGRIIAFHDIGWLERPMPSSKLPIDVPKIWDAIKPGQRFVEIKQCARDNGIGVLWRS